MGSTRKVSLTAVIIMALVGAILIAGCTSTTTPSVPQTQTAGTGQGTSQLPTANAGADQTGKVGAIVTLDGRKSNASSGGGGLTYAWSLSSAPNGSAVRLANQTTDRATFVPDKAGTYVVSLIVTNRTGAKSAADTTNVTVISAGRVDTKLIVDTPSSKADYYLGEQMTINGRLVDADGNGIANQTIRFKSVSRVLGFTYDYPIEPVTTDSTGAFTKVFDPISAQDAPSFVKTVDTEAWVYYDGNDLYNPTSTTHAHVTVHLTSPPS
jgi:PKD repeat protein